MNLERCFKEGLLRHIKPSIEKADKSIGVAKGYIQKAKDNLHMKNYDICIIACYTSMFHAARALLFRDGIKEKSHVCIIEYLRKNYPNLGRLVNSVDSYRRIRHTALYGLDILFNEEDALNGIREGEEFLLRIREILASGRR